MAGVGKMLKQAAKMQKKLEELQEELSQKMIEVSSGGGAVNIVINGQSDIQKIDISADLLKEDKDMVESVLLEAVQEATRQARALNEEETQKVSGGFAIPGLM